MRWIGLLVVAALLVGVWMFFSRGRKAREAQALADAREEALRWYERLGGQIMNLPPGDDAATRQALVDAGERYNAAGGQMERATTVKQYELARETALEGLAYVRAARVAMKLDPGPELPPLAGQRRAGAVTQERSVDVRGRQYKASPHPAGDTPYYYPGGMVSGRPVPAGWYSEPWWKTALVAGAWGIGTALVFDALFSPGWGGGYGGGFGGFDAGYGAGYDQGFEAGADWDGDHGDFSDAGGGDFGGDFGDFGFDDGGDYGGGDFGGDAGGGDFFGF